MSTSGAQRRQCRPHSCGRLRALGRSRGAAQWHAGGRKGGNGKAAHRKREARGGSKVMKRRRASACQSEVGGGRDARCGRRRRYTSATSTRIARAHYPATGGEKGRRRRRHTQVPPTRQLCRKRVRGNVQSMRRKRRWRWWQTAVSNCMGNVVRWGGGMASWESGQPTLSAETEAGGGGGGRERARLSMHQALRSF